MQVKEIRLRALAARVSAFRYQTSYSWQSGAVGGGHLFGQHRWLMVPQILSWRALLSQGCSKKQIWLVSSRLLNECCLETLYNTLTSETTTGPRRWKTAKCVLTFHHWAKARGGMILEIELLCSQNYVPRNQNSHRSMLHPLNKEGEGKRWWVGELGWLSLDYILISFFSVFYGHPCRQDKNMSWLRACPCWNGLLTTIKSLELRWKSSQISHKKDPSL